MAVQEQSPIIVYVANGTTTQFAIPFDLHDLDALFVLVNGEAAAVGSYSVIDSAVVFGAAPADGSMITLYRDTKLDRTTNYKTYDNSFRPESVNWDFDKIWHVLQEANIVDAKILARIKEEIEWRRTHDFNYDELAQVREQQLFDALKGYADTLYSATNPNVFQGVIAGVVFARDGKSIQTHIEEILDNLAVSREDIESKASQTYVDEQLSTKAPQETTYTKAEVDTAIGAISTDASKQYATLAAANADIANIALNQNVFVSEAENGGYWYKATAGATSLTKSDYDPVSIANDNLLFRPSNKFLLNYDLDDYVTGGIHVFNNAPVDPEVSKNFPAYGVGNGGTLFVMAVKAGDTSEVVRQVYVSRDAMYFRSRYIGVFESWTKLAKDSDLTSLLTEFNASLANPVFRTAAGVDLNNYTTAGMVVFSSAPSLADNSLNFPAYGSGNAGTLLILGAKNGVANTVIRQIYISRNNMYFRATFNGTFEDWKSSVNDAQVSEIVNLNSIVKPIFIDNTIGKDLNNYTKVGMVVFSVSPQSGTAFNFPAYGSGNAGALLVLGGHESQTTTIVRQIYISASQMYFRSNASGVFGDWVKLASFDNLAQVERDTNTAKSWMYLDGRTLKKDRGTYPDYYTKTNVELWTGVNDWYARYDALMAAHPTLVTRESIGNSVQGRPIYAYTISPPPKRLTGSWEGKKPPKIIIQACLHGWEYNSTIALLGFLENMLDRFKFEDNYSTLRNTFELVVIPLANPDGAEVTQRENANGVDLNRDFVAQTQIETQLLTAFYNNHLDALHFIDLHAHGEPELFWIGTNDNYDFAVAFGNELVGDCQRRFLSASLNPDSQWLYIAPSIADGTCVNFFTNNNVNSILLENLNGTGHVSGFTDSWLTCRKISVHSVNVLLNFMLKTYNNSVLNFPK